MDAHIEMAWEDGAGCGLRCQAAFAGLVLLFSVVVSTIYRLGYSSYRGSELSKPLIGTVMADVPPMLTGNPCWRRG